MNKGIVLLAKYKNKRPGNYFIVRYREEYYFLVKEELRPTYELMTHYNYFLKELTDMSDFGTRNNGDIIKMLYKTNLKYNELEKILYSEL